MPSPGVASEQSPDGKVQPLEKAVFPECFECILRACGRESAAWLLQRRDTDLIESYQEYERKNGNLSDGCQDLILSVH